MNTRRLIVRAVALTFCVVAGAAVALHSGPANNPSSVAESGVRAEVTYDYETVCDLAAKTDRNDRFANYPANDCAGYAKVHLDALFGDELPDVRAVYDDTDIDLSSKEIEASATKATVRVIAKWSYEGEDRNLASLYLPGGGALKGEDEWIVTLLKEEGKWRIDRSA